MSTENSSLETRNRAHLLATEINCTHYDLSIDEAFKSFYSTANKVFNH